MTSLSTDNKSHGVHTFGFVIKILENGEIRKSRNWDANSMFVTMPNAQTSLHIERLPHDQPPAPRQYKVTLAEPASALGQAALERTGHDVERALNADEVASLLRQVHGMQCNRHAHDSAAPTSQRTR